MKKNILNKKTDTNADYKMLIENIYIDIRYSAENWADNYSQYVKNDDFSRVTEADMDSARSNVLLAMEPFKDRINAILGSYDLDYKLEKHFRELQKNINLFEKSLNETPGSMRNLVSLRANFEENEIIKELGCEQFTISTLDDLRLHVKNTPGGEDFIVKEYFIKAVSDLEKYKTYLAKEFCEGDTSSAEVISEKNFEENESSLKLSGKFNKKKQEIKKEIGLVQISLETFRILQNSFENAKPEEKKAKVQLLLEENLPRIEQQWKAKVAEHKKKSAQALVEEGFLIDSVIGVIDELAAAEIKYESSVFQIGSSMGKKDKSQGVIKKAQIDLKNAEDNMKYSRKRSLEHLSDLANLEISECRDFLTNIKNQIEFGKKRITENGKYVDVVAKFLEDADKILIKKVGFLVFFGECLEDFRKKFEKINSSKETMFENYFKIKCRLFVIKRLFSDGKYLEEQVDIKILEEIIKVFNSASNKAEVVDISDNQEKTLKTLEKLKKDFELMEKIIKNGETKFNNSVVSVNSLKSDTTSSTLSESRIPAVTDHKTVPPQGSSVFKPVSASPPVFQGLPVPLSAADPFRFSVSSPTVGPFGFPVSSPTSTPAFTHIPQGLLPANIPFGFSMSSAMSKQVFSFSKKNSSMTNFVFDSSLLSSTPALTNALVQTPKSAGNLFSNTSPVLSEGTNIVNKQGVNQASAPKASSATNSLMTSFGSNSSLLSSNSSSAANPEVFPASPSPKSFSPFSTFNPVSHTSSPSDNPDGLINVVDQQKLDQTNQNSSPNVSSATNPLMTVFGDKGADQEKPENTTTLMPNSIQPQNSTSALSSGQSKTDSELSVTSPSMTVFSDKEADQEKPENTSTLMPNSIQPQNLRLAPSLEKSKTDSDPILSTPLQTNAALADGDLEILGNPPQHVTTLDHNSDIIKKDDLVNHSQESASSSTVNQNIVTNQEAPSSGVTNSEAGNLASTNSENVKKPWFRRFVDWIGNHISSGLARILNKFLNNFSEELPKKLPDFAKPDVTTHNTNITNITKQNLDKEI